MSFKLLLKSFLSFQLLLLIFRQIIDFCGIQWLMILVNALAIIITICALFGYYMIFILFQFLLIVYNIVVVCFYLGLIDKNSKILSFDSNSRSFWFQIIQNWLELKDDSFLESVVNYLEIVQSLIHCLISAVLIILLIIHFERLRTNKLRENSKTTPPLPPYTISPINTVYMTSTMNSNSSSIRRKRRQRSSQRRQKQIQTKLIANNYSDSETDFYQSAYGLTNGLTNPLYCNRNSFMSSETRI